MKRIIRLTENDLTRIVRRVIKEQDTQTSGGTGGPLTGSIVVRNQPAKVRVGDTLEFKFRAIKNSGNGPITINKITPMNSNMSIETKVPFTVNPGQTFELIAKQKLVKDGTAYRNMDGDGYVDIEERIIIETNGKKPKYTLYCRQELQFI